MNRFVLIVLVLLPFTVFGVIEDYYRPECNHNSLCVPKVLDNMSKLFFNYAFCKFFYRK